MSSRRRAAAPPPPAPTGRRLDLVVLRASLPSKSKPGATPATTGVDGPPSTEDQLRTADQQLQVYHRRIDALRPELALLTNLATTQSEECSILGKELKGLEEGFQLLGRDISNEDEELHLIDLVVAAGIHMNEVMSLQERVAPMQLRYEAEGSYINDLILDVNAIEHAGDKAELHAKLAELSGQQIEAAASNALLVAQVGLLRHRLNVIIHQAKNMVEEVSDRPDSNQAEWCRQYLTDLGIEVLTPAPAESPSMSAASG